MTSSRHVEIIDMEVRHVVIIFTYGVSGRGNIFSPVRMPVSVWVCHSVHRFFRWAEKTMKKKTEKNCPGKIVSYKKRDAAYYHKSPPFLYTQNKRRVEVIGGHLSSSLNIHGPYCTRLKIFRRGHDAGSVLQLRCFDQIIKSGG